MIYVEDSRVCQLPECANFYVPKDSRGRYCSDDHAHQNWLREFRIRTGESYDALVSRDRRAVHQEAA